MARYVRTIEVPTTLKETFEYLADFGNTATWDPGVERSRALTPGPIGPGSRFDVAAAFLGRSVELRYELTRFEPHRRVAFEGEGESLRSIDEILVEETASGSRVTWDATIALKGALSLADPLLQLAFLRIGNAAVEGLASALTSRARRE